MNKGYKKLLEKLRKEQENEHIYEYEFIARIDKETLEFVPFEKYMDYKDTRKISTQIWDDLGVIYSSSLYNELKDKPEEWFLFYYNKLFDTTENKIVFDKI